MGRWTQYDEDEYRLPSGMKRVGYDADYGCYLFRDQDGSTWKSAEGSEYGELTRVAELPSSLAGSNADDLEAAPTFPNGYQLLSTDANSTMAHRPQVNINASAYRKLFPFFLMITVSLLLVWRLILSPGLSTPTEKCPADTKSYYIQPGDSCWDVAKAHDITLEQLQTLNPALECNPLIPGTSVCLPSEQSP